MRFSKLRLTGFKSFVDPTDLVMGQGMLRRLTQAARNTTVGGFLQWTTDQFGRQLAVYNGLPIRVVDGNRIANEVLGFNEAGSGGSNATATSIYCLSLNPMGVVGLQSGPMQVKDLGEIDDKPARRTRIEWNIGMADIGRYSIARLRGIADAPVVI